MSVSHYENFPVASWLCPAALRPAIRAIYCYARTADDIADEGVATPQHRLATLRRYRSSLHACLGDDPGTEWPQVFRPLAAVIVRHGLALAPFEDLLDAFEQDCEAAPYVDRAALLEYCRRSANPVGRLLLALYGVDDPAALRHADAICSALQLINFWQDASVDIARGRNYFPISDLRRCGLTTHSLRTGADTPATRQLAADLCAWARGMMLAGAPLALHLPGRVGFELRVVVQGGLRVLERIAAGRYAILSHRETIGRRDLPLLLWRACTMREPTSTLQQGAPL